MTSGITSSAITDRQRKQFFRFLEDGGEKALVQTGIEKNGLQRLFENGGEFQDNLISLIEKYCVSNEFANEEVESSFGYLSGYKPSAIVAQTNKLRELFPGIGYANGDLLTQVEKGEVAIPAGAEGYFAIPHWSKVAPTYQAAVEKVLALLGKAYGGRFTNYRQGQLGPQYLQEIDRKAWSMQQLKEKQGSDILILPAQFGLRHRGRSVRRARAIMGENEFGLGAYEIGIMLLTHPDRLQNVNDLWIDAGGDKFVPDAGAGGIFGNAPFFRFHGDKVKFDCRSVVGATEGCGSASGVLLQ